MEIKIAILELLETSKKIGKNSMQFQNLDHLLGRRGERYYLGSNLLLKLNELEIEEFIVKENKNYSIKDKGIYYLKNKML